MVTNIGDIAATATLNIQPFEQNTRNLRTYLRGLDSSLKSSEINVKGYGDKVNNLKSIYNQTGQSMQGYKTLLDKQKESYDKLINATGDLNKATTQQKQDIAGAKAAMSDTETKLASLSNKYRQLGQDIATQSSNWTKFGSAATNLGNGLQKTSDLVGTIGQKANMVSLPVALGMGKAYSSAVTFNSEIKSMGALLDDGQTSAKELQEQLNGLSKASLGWSQQYGVSTTNINSGMSELIKKGYTYNQVLGAMPSILDASRASGDDFNSVMSVSTSILEQYGLKAEDTQTTLKNTQRVTDSLTYVANKTAAGFSDMGLAMEYVGPVSHSLGISLEETSSAIGLMSNNGIEGEKAGTALRGALSKLLKPSKDNAAAMESMGISVEDFKNGTLKLPDILDKIKNNTKNWTKEQKASAIALAFGTEAQTGMNVLVNQGGDALRNLTKETENASGYTKKLADQMNNTDKAKLDKFKTSLNALAITIGQDVIPVFTPLIEKATSMIKKFSEMDDATKENIVKWGLLIAAAGPALKLLSGGIGTFASIAKGVGAFSTAMGKLTGKAAANKLAMEMTEEGFLKVASSASAAGGIGGIAGFSGAIVTAMPWVLGITAAVGVGYGAWKLFGEEAWNSSQRVKKWGTDVGDEADAALTKFKNFSDTSNQSYFAFDQGTETSSKNIEKNVNNMLTSIKDTAKDVKKEYEEVIKDLPETAQEIAKKNEQIKLEENKRSVQLAESSSKQITEIYKRHAKDHTELSEDEKSMVTASMQQMTSEEINILNLSKGQKKQVYAAMYGDISNLTAKQAKEYANTLNSTIDKEKNSYNKQLQALKDARAEGLLTDQDYYAQSKSLTEKHTETQNKLSSSMIEAYKKAGLSEASIRDVFRILRLDYDSAASYADKKNDEIDNANTLIAQSTKNMSNNTIEANQKWNDLIFDKKTGEIVTNAKDVIADFSATKEGWEQLQFIDKYANLKTDARKTIAEAYIQNGKWNDLTFEQKEALIKNDNTTFLIDAAESNHYWNDLSFETKQAFVESDTPEKVAQAISDAGLWNDLDYVPKQLKAENYDFLSKINESKESLQKFNEENPDLKKLLIDGTQKMNAEDAKKALEEYNKLPTDTKKLVMESKDYQDKLKTAQGLIDTYNATHPLDKKINVDSGEAKVSVEQLTGKINFFNQTDVPEKNMEVNNSDATQKTKEAQEKLEQYIQTNPVLKILEANNSSAVNKAEEAKQAISRYNAEPTPDKFLNVLADTYGVTAVQQALNSVNDKTVTIRTVYYAENINDAPPGYTYATRARGTGNHPGGDMLVNDQVGSNYQEYVEFPNGYGFIPEGRNVYIPSAPRGTKVLTASKTKELFPAYANGIGFENTNISKVASRLGAVQNKNITSNVNVTNSTNSELTSLLKQMMNFISRMSPTINVYPQSIDTDTDVKELSRKLAYLTEIQGAGKL